MSIYAEVSPGGSVVNMVQWDGTTPFNVTPNTLVSATGQPNAQVGGTFLAGVFTAPAAPAPAQGVLFMNSPATGATIALPNAPQPQAKLYAVLQPAAALATLNLQLSAAPLDGDDLYLISTKAITAVTPLAPGQGLINVPSPFPLAAGVSQHIFWSAQLASWVRL